MYVSSESWFFPIYVSAWGISLLVLTAIFYRRSRKWKDLKCTDPVEKA